MKQITLSSGRFYEEGGVFYPSVTTVLGKCFPKGEFLSDWKAEVGKEEANRILVEAGDDGTAVHNAIDQMIHGAVLQSKDFNKKQKKCIMSFLKWWEYEKPIVLGNEYQIKYSRLQEDGSILRYAGSVDFKCRVRSDDYTQIWVVDYKTSRSLQDYHKAQVSAYIKADPLHADSAQGALLHLGNSTSKGYSWVPINLQKAWNMFRLSLQMFFEMNPDPKPAEEEYFPDTFSISSFKKESDKIIAS